MLEISFNHAMLILALAVIGSAVVTLLLVEWFHRQSAKWVEMDQCAFSGMPLAAGEFDSTNAGNLALRQLYRGDLGIDFIGAVNICARTKYSINNRIDMLLSTPDGLANMKQFITGKSNIEWIFDFAETRGIKVVIQPTLMTKLSAVRNAGWIPTNGGRSWVSPYNTQPHGLEDAYISALFQIQAVHDSDHIRDAVRTLHNAGWLPTGKHAITWSKDSTLQLSHSSALFVHLLECMDFPINQQALTLDMIKDAMPLICVTDESYSNNEWLDLVHESFRKSNARLAA